MIRNDLRFSGLASGMDTESIVKKMMTAQRLPMDRMEQKKQTLTWQRDTYREINAMLLEFRNLSFDMKLEGSYLTKKVSSSDEKIVKVSANGEAFEGIQTVEVEAIARGASVTSSAALNSAKDSGGNVKTLKEQFAGIGNKVTIAINDTTRVEFDTTKETIYDVVGKINNAKDLNGKSLGIKASYDADLNRIFINTASTGTVAKIDLKDVNGGNFLTQHLKLDLPETPITGVDAKIKLNGQSFTMSTNQFSINGINFDLQNAAPGTEVRLNINSDTDKVLDKIVKFIGKYNEIIEKINGRVSEKRNRDFQPLTEAQKAEMTEKQIEKWEEKAKSGILAGDSLLSGLMSQLRIDFSTEVKGLPSEMNSIFDLGFKTGNYMEKGKIIIDEDKMKEALTKNLDGVMKLFTVTDTDDSSKRGLADRLYQNISNTMKDITDKAGSSGTQVDDSFIGESLGNLDKDMRLFERKLQMIESRYWKQFNAMESAIQKSNSQSSWLMQQFSTGGTQ